MVNFILRDSDYPKIPALLLSSVPGFRESPEYRDCGAHHADLTSVVGASFARFLARLHAMEEPNSAAESIRAAHAVIEKLSTTPETPVEELLTYEIFETMDLAPEARGRFIAQLGPGARELYDRWNRKRMR